MIPVVEVVIVEHFTREQIAEGRSEIAEYAARTALEKGIIGPGPAPEGFFWLVVGTAADGRLHMTARAGTFEEMPPVPPTMGAALAEAAEGGRLPVFVALSTRRGIELSACALGADAAESWVRVIRPAHLEAAAAAAAAAVAKMDTFQHDAAPTCPGCAARLDAMTAVEPGARPKTGDLVCCCYCRAWLTVTEGGGIRLISEAERAALPPEIRQDMERAAEMSRPLSARYPARTTL